MSATPVTIPNPAQLMGRVAAKRPMTAAQARRSQEARVRAMGIGLTARRKARR